MPSHKEPRTSPRRVLAVERQRQAIELRTAGATFAAIAKALGYATAYGAQMAVEAGLRKIVLPAAEEYRKVDAKRLDDLLLAVWQQAKAGNLEHWDRALKVVEAQFRHAGLQPEDSPGAVAMAAAHVTVLIQSGQIPQDIGTWRKEIVEGHVSNQDGDKPALGPVGDPPQ